MDVFNRMLREIRSRVFMMIARGVLQAVEDKEQAQICQVSLLDGELKSNVERVQNYGVRSVPPSGARVTSLFVAGDRSHGLIIAAEDRALKLVPMKSGEVCIYTDEGDEIYLKRGREIAVKTSKFVIHADEIEMNGAVKISETLDVAGNITGAAEVADAAGPMSEIRTVFDGHTHKGNAGAPTSPPEQTMGG